MLSEPFSLFIAPNYLGSGNRFSRSWQSMISKLQYDTGGRRKALEMGDRFPALKGFRPHGLTTRFWFFLTTYFGRLLSGWPHFVFSLPVFYLRLLPPTCFFDRFLGDHLCFLEARVLTTFLTIVRSGLHGNSSTREHENVRFGWQNSTKKHYLALEKHKNRSWGGRGRKFKSCHSDHIECS